MYSANAVNHANCHSKFENCNQHAKAITQESEVLFHFMRPPNLLDERRMSNYFEHICSPISL